jgi:prefoldin subunit 5
MALIWKNTPEPDPPQSDPPPDLDIATKCATHAGNIAAAVVLEQFKKIEELKNELAGVRNEVQELKQQVSDIEQFKKDLASTQGQVQALDQKVFSVAYQEERLPAAVRKLESCSRDPNHLPAAFKNDGHALCADCYFVINGKP